MYPSEDVLIVNYFSKMDTSCTMRFCMCFCCLVRNPVREDGAPVAAGQAADQAEARDANGNVITVPL